MKDWLTLFFLIVLPLGMSAFMVWIGYCVWRKDRAAECSSCEQRYTEDL